MAGLSFVPTFTVDVSLEFSNHRPLPLSLTVIFNPKTSKYSLNRERKARSEISSCWIGKVQDGILATGSIAWHTAHWDGGTTMGVSGCENLWSQCIRWLLGSITTDLKCGRESEFLQGQSAFFLPDSVSLGLTHGYQGQQTSTGEGRGR